ncbi:flavin-containing monooxygenase [Azospirillum canadense]|uniref:flavin-containing monooxygenase n=1 Tax=Azospirillum canadense TaxID=403962 RepID=UPI002227D042|nr:NAD(P)/FAD-dependent oxidoreductase [Azospirillum canadense]MCW2239025.1 putative flavoprotein involved in K+ transport [Azospirillum canadense]
MEADTSILDAAVVGAGWAGLGVSHALSQAGLRHCVLERGRIGETWRTQRWDSFRMNTPNRVTVMPGDHYEGADPEGFLTRDGFVALLEQFAARNRLPIRTGSPVTELVQDEESGGYRLATPDGTLRARNVIIASGSLNRPRRPAVADALPPGLIQVDASDYRNPAALPVGAVLVVGSGQSGGQIAEDLVLAGRRVYLATSRIRRFPRRYRGQDIVQWLLQAGWMDVPRRDFVEPSGRIPPRPLLGAVHTISLQSLSAQGVVLLGRFTGVADSVRLTFANDLPDNMTFADEASDKLKRKIDDFIAQNGLQAPAAEPDPAEIVAPRLPNPLIRSLAPTGQGITTVIWCTGFEGDYHWVRLPGVLDARGQPVHEESVANLPGIYFAGLDFAVTRRSGTIMAIAEEARRVVQHITARRP